MIANSNVNEVTKAIMKLLKLMFYLLFYLHCLACYWWICVSYNAPAQYHFQAYDGIYKNAEDGEIYMVDGKVFKADPDDPVDVMWGKPSTFGDIRGDKIDAFYRD